jgi:phosphate-selective porin OprO/OprP
VKRSVLIRALLATSALFLGSAANGQTPEPSDQARELDEAKAKIERLQAQVDALQKSIAQIQAQMTKATPSWKGAPQLEDKSAGWSFKPRGRIQYDVGYVSNPDDAVVTRNLGFNSRARRIRLGAEGTIPGGFGYKYEMDFANASVSFGDVIITYTPKDQPFSLTVGNHFTFSGLDQMTSSNFTSFLERAQMTEAFGGARRIGVSAGLQDKENIFRFNAGLFAAHSIDASNDNEGWIGAARATYSPELMGGMVHLGANYQHRKFQSNNDQTPSNSVGAPSTNQIARYRARPFSQLTDIRFVDTGNFAAESDNIYGLEVGGIFKSFHFAGEAQWTKVQVGYDPGDILSGLDQFVFNSATGCPTTANCFPVYVVPTSNPGFFSAYGEIGYFLTGETRGYKNGAWDRTKVLHPFSKGGWGALEVNGRMDYLDLDDDGLQNGLSNNFVTGQASLASTNSRLGRGGKQLGFLGSLIWIPEDYARVLVNYTHSWITGGPYAATVKPDSSKPVDKRKYGVDTIAARFQVDF